MSKYAVETLMGCEWENCWKEDDVAPLVFDSFEEAQTALLEFLDDIEEAVKAGLMHYGYDKADYRIVRVNG